MEAQAVKETKSPAELGIEANKGPVVTPSTGQPVEAKDTEQVKREDHTGAKNLMFLTFKIMRTVSLAFQDLEKMGKDVSKSTKEEWEYWSKRMSKNSEKGKDNLEGAKVWLFQAGALAGALAEPGLQFALKNEGLKQFLEGKGWKSILETGVKTVAPQVKDGCNSMMKNLGEVTGQEVGIEGALLQQKTQEFTSNYQNSTGDQSSTKQLVSETGSTLQQLLRIQGEMLTGKA